MITRSLNVHPVDYLEVQKHRILQLVERDKTTTFIKQLVLSGDSQLYKFSLTVLDCLLWRGFENYNTMYYTGCNVV